jgi:formamidopyrimidine-DNA glycosylase
MPELPEVETVVRTFRPRAVGLRIAGFGAHWARTVSPAAGQIAAATAGLRVADVTRRGKYIVMHLAKGDGAAPFRWMLVHLKMSGRLDWDESSDGPGARRRRPPPPADTGHVRAWWDFETGERLLFRDARKFGRVHLTDDLSRSLAPLGIEPLSPEFTVDALSRLLRGRRRQLKPLLLDQTAIAGLGNIYTDEALYEARLHPLVSSDRLRPAQVAALHSAIREVLERGIASNGASIDPPG